MKTKVYPSDEVGDEYNALVGFGSRNNLPLGRKPVKDLRGQIPRLPELRDILFGDRRSRPPALKAGSGHGLRFEATGKTLGVGTRGGRRRGVA